MDLLIHLIIMTEPNVNACLIFNGIFQQRLAKLIAPLQGLLVVTRLPLNVVVTQVTLGIPQ